VRGKRVIPTLASIVTAACLSVSPPSAEAQQVQPPQHQRAGKWYLGVLGELGKPQSPSNFKEYFGRSASFGLNFGRLPLTTRHLTAELSAQYTRFFAENNQPIQFNALEAGLELRAYSNEVNNASAAFYVAAGANFALTELNISLPPQTRQAILESGEKFSEQKPAIVGGAGVMLFAGSVVAIDVGVRYHHIFTSGQQTSFTTAGFRFDFLFGNPQ